MAMMAMTTSNSMRVNPGAKRDLGESFIPKGSESGYPNS
jgi:hypothetical protein